MLTLTPDAADAVETILSQPELPDTAGLRIVAEPRMDEGSSVKTDLRLDVVDAPEPSDEVIEGGPIFVEQATAELLEEKTLDARVEANQVQFSIHEQGDA